MHRIKRLCISVTLGGSERVHLFPKVLMRYHPLLHQRVRYYANAVRILELSRVICQEAW